MYVGRGDLIRGYFPSDADKTQPSVLSDIVHRGNNIACESEKKREC